MRLVRVHFMRLLLNNYLDSPSLTLPCSTRRYLGELLRLDLKLRTSPSIGSQTFQSRSCLLGLRMGPNFKPTKEQVSSAEHSNLPDPDDRYSLARCFGKLPPFVPRPDLASKSKVNNSFRRALRETVAKAASVLQLGWTSKSKSCPSLPGIPSLKVCEGGNHLAVPCDLILQPLCNLTSSPPKLLPSRRRLGAGFPLKAAALPESKQAHVAPSQCCVCHLPSKHFAQTLSNLQRGLQGHTCRMGVQV